MERLESRYAHPSRLNGENIAGAAFLFFSFLFMLAGRVNAVFALLYPVDYLLAAIGITLVLFGYRTWRNETHRTKAADGRHGLY